MLEAAIAYNCGQMLLKSWATPPAKRPDLHLLGLQELGLDHAAFLPLPHGGLGVHYKAKATSSAASVKELFFGVDLNGRVNGHGQVSNPPRAAGTHMLELRAQ